jgi:phytoene dehydrogenase-like protein
MLFLHVIEKYFAAAGRSLAGSSVHLGGGIPLCIGSGMIAADMPSEDWS